MSERARAREGQCGGERVRVWRERVRERDGYNHTVLLQGPVRVSVFTFPAGVSGGRRPVMSDMKLRSDT